MSETVLVAVIAAISSVVGSYTANKAISEKKGREAEIAAAQREQRQQDRLESIERKLDIHNGYAEKLGAIQMDMAAIHKDIEYLKGGKK
jgi:hypothetical protein